jgi:hypothetical protein
MSKFSRDLEVYISPSPIQILLSAYGRDLCEITTSRHPGIGPAGLLPWLANPSRSFSLDQGLRSSRTNMMHSAVRFVLHQTYFLATDSGATLGCQQKHLILLSGSTPLIGLRATCGQGCDQVQCTTHIRNAMQLFREPKNAKIRHLVLIVSGA